MSKLIYETVDGTQDGFVSGAGQIVNGRIESNIVIENPNFRLISESNDSVQPPTVISGTASQQNPVQPLSAGEPSDIKPGVNLG